MDSELVLASASPRRLELLRGAGYRVKPIAPNVNEERIAKEPPEDYVRRLAELKADTVANRVARDAWVLGSDTVVVAEDGSGVRILLGKPRDEAHARDMLRMLAGRDHEVLTGVCIVQRARGVKEIEVDTTCVRFRGITETEIAGYVATGEPLDKAGAYAIQGGAATFVERIEGSYSNVVGLPLERVQRIFKKICGRRERHPHR